MWGWKMQRDNYPQSPWLKRTRSPSSYISDTIRLDTINLPNHARRNLADLICCLFSDWLNVKCHNIVVELSS